MVGLHITAGTSISYHLFYMLGTYTTKALIDKLTGEGSASKLQLMQELFGMSREELLVELTKQTGDE